MNSNLEWRHMKKRKPVYPIEVKKAAIEDLENGKKTAKEIMEEFNIQRDTIRGWKRQVEYYKNGMFYKKRHSKVIRLKAAREVVMGF